MAAGIGGVIANRAFLAGATGGCQAEIGSASAMAAGGVAYLMGGDAEQISHAAAPALKNLLGLACDPVAGLVEVPCVKRNVMGAVNAMTSSDMVMAGITSKIPPDEVIDAMRAIGRKHERGHPRNRKRRACRNSDRSGNPGTNGWDIITGVSLTVEQQILWCFLRV